MPAKCRCCQCGKIWTARVIEDDDSTNCTTVDPDYCPVCDPSGEFEIVEIYSYGD